MADVTLATLREYICRELGFWKEITTTSAGDGTLKDTFISTELSELKDGSIRDHYALITDSTTTALEGVSKKIKAFQSPTGTAVTYSAYTAQVPTASTIEITKVDPVEIKAFINQCIRDSYPELCKEVHDTTLVSGNILPTFENWDVTTYPNYWRNSTATATEDTTSSPFGGSCVKLGTAAGYLYLSSDNFKDLLFMENSARTLHCWVKTAAASNARVALYYLSDDGSTTDTEYSSYHTGGGEWELLEIDSFNFPDDMGEIQVRLVTATTDDARVAHCHLNSNWHESYLPETIDRIYYAYECNDADEFAVDEAGGAPIKATVVNKSGTRYVQLSPVGHGLGTHNHVVLIGTAQLSALSADTDTIDISTEWNKIIVFGVVAIYLRNRANQVSAAEMEAVRKDAQGYQGEYERLKATNRMAITPATGKRMMV